MRATIMSQPSGVFMGGPGYGLDNYTVGAMMANEYTLFIVVAVAIMALQTAVRHTRGENPPGESSRCDPPAWGGTRHRLRPRSC